MKVKVLVENTSISEEIGSEHGLSLYIEVNDTKLLFDVGETNLFIKNAIRLGVNIEDIDYLIVSHGHKDHGGGLDEFIQINNKAKILINNNAFKPHYAARGNGAYKDIGLDKNLETHSQVIKVKGDSVIKPGIELFSNIKIVTDKPISNDGLYEKLDGNYVKDNFDHEQNLIIEDGGKSLLIVGCAHNGIINIIKHFQALKGKLPDYVIGGFHLSSRSSGNETPQKIDEIGKYLLQTGVKYYTCHCTGIEAYDRLKNIMTDKIEYLAGGMEIIL